MIRVPHLETDVTSACQLSCVACNHHVPLYRRKGPGFADPKQVFADLHHLAGFLHAEAWAAIGGEPLLHKDLLSVLTSARASGVADTIELWTNGLWVRRMPAVLWPAFDTLVLSIYPGILSSDDVLWIEDKCHRERKTLVKKDERQNPNFRTLFEPKHQQSGPELDEKFQRCFFRQYSRVANNGFFFTCCCAPHMGPLLKDRPFGEDGIRISTSTEESVSTYLTRSTPLRACHDCAGRDTAVPILWREEREPEQWLIASGRQG